MKGSCLLGATGARTAGVGVAAAAVTDETKFIFFGGYCALSRTVLNDVHIISCRFPRGQQGVVGSGPDGYGFSGVAASMDPAEWGWTLRRPLITGHIPAPR